MNDKGKMSKTRVVSGGKGKTPIEGAPQHVEINQTKARVSKGPGLPRKNEPEKAGVLGRFNIGARVTSKGRK